MVRTIAVPADVAALAGLEPVHYEEAFAFDTGAVRSPLEWSQLILEGAPALKRLQMRSAWTALGIRLAMPGSRDQVLGWRVRHNGPDAVVLGARAAIGLTARIVVRVEHDRVLHTMLVRYDGDLGRRVWTWLALRHRRFLVDILHRASQSDRALR